MSRLQKHQTVDDYIKGSAQNVAPLLEDLRGFIHAAMPEATEGMQYGTPIFKNANGVPVIYLFGSERHVNFGFLRSRALNDPQGVLKGSGRPSKHIKVFPDQPYDKALLRDFVNQSAAINNAEHPHE